jgi:AcrR family transcriptional regulator
MKPSPPATGRPNQKIRTRQHLLEAAARLLKAGRNPTLEEVAAEALVSRATAYRYFPRIDALLHEASLNVVIPDTDEIFRGDRSVDPVKRLERADAAMHDAILANEASLRTMLVHALQQQRAGGVGEEVPARQNRRTPVIEAALAPARHEFPPAALRTLQKALALVIGTEAMLVCKDVLRLDDAETRRVKRWAIRALVDAARRT